MNFSLMQTRGTKTISRQSPILLVSGDGKTLPGDLCEFDKLGVRPDRMVIGRSVQCSDTPILHYCDVDSDAGKWVAENLEAQYPDKIKDDHIIRHTFGGPDDAPWFDYTWDVKGNLMPSDEIMWHGSTALFAVLIGIAMRYDRIVLAGCPMDSKGHWYFPKETTGPRWQAEDYQVWFEFAASIYADRVRSMSGYTRLLLGEPTRGWLYGYP